MKTYLTTKTLHLVATALTLSVFLYALETQAQASTSATWAHYHAVRGNTDDLAKVLEEGTTANAKTEENKTPLHCATIINDLEKFRTVLILLKEAGASPSLQDVYGSTPLHLLAESPRQIKLKIFLEVFADEVEQFIDIPDTDGNTALHLSLMHNHSASAIELLQHKANLTVTNGEGLNPFGCCNNPAILNYIRNAFKE